VVGRLPPVTAVVAVAAVACALTFPVEVFAASLTTSERCLRVVTGQRTFPVLSSGFTPGAVVTVTADGRTVGSGIADASGTWSELLPAPPITDGRRVSRTFEVTAMDSRGVFAAPITVDAIRLTARLPRRSGPRERVPYRVFGFASGRPVYLHVRRDGRTRESFRLGTPAGPCGRLSRRMRFMPLRRWSTGVYDYWFTQTRRFERDAEPAVALRVLIPRRPARRAA